MSRPSSQDLLPFLLLATFFYLVSGEISYCNRTCGHFSVGYPFGFSPECPIVLNCTETADIHINGYAVRNITSNKIFVDVPPDCDRPAQSVLALFGANHAMTARNGLFLRNCTSAPSGCHISTDIIAWSLAAKGCGSNRDDTRCFPGAAIGGFLSPENISAVECKSLFISGRYGGDNPLQPELVFGTAEVGWWVNGQCRCSRNAKCTYWTPQEDGTKRYNCMCDEGFVGDGYADGEGCREG